MSFTREWTAVQVSVCSNKIVTALLFFLLCLKYTTVVHLHLTFIVLAAKDALITF